MKFNYFFSSIFLTPALTLTLGASLSLASEGDPHVEARNKLIDTSMNILFEAERNVSWSCDTQHQDQLLKIHEQWIPAPYPSGKMADSTLWHNWYIDLAEIYSSVDCYDIAIELVQSALVNGEYVPERELKSTKFYLEALKADKREGYLSPANPRHPRYGDESYDPYEDEEAYSQ